MVYSIQYDFTVINDFTGATFDFIDFLKAQPKKENRIVINLMQVDSGELEQKAKNAGFFVKNDPIYDTIEFTNPKNLRITTFLSWERCTGLEFEKKKENVLIASEIKKATGHTLCGIAYENFRNCLQNEAQGKYNSFQTQSYINRLYPTREAEPHEVGIWKICKECYKPFVMQKSGKYNDIVEIDIVRAFGTVAELYPLPYGKATYNNAGTFEILSGIAKEDFEYLGLYFCQGQRIAIPNPPNDLRQKLLKSESLHYKTTRKGLPQYAKYCNALHNSDIAPFIKRQLNAIIGNFARVRIDEQMETVISGYMPVWLAIVWKVREIVYTTANDDCIMANTDSLFVPREKAFNTLLNLHLRAKIKHYYRHIEI